MLSFLQHLRLNYQYFILSGPFFLGGLLSPHSHPYEFLLQFLSTYTLLFGGVTVYNSYWDKDEGPIGGLKHPPPLQKWMLATSWILQFFGFIIAIWSGIMFTFVYIVSALFFWLYSSPHTRWKGKPLLSLVAISIATALSSFVWGYISFGGISFIWPLVPGACAAICLVLSMYPLSQTYQINADRARGDQTFAVHYGVTGVQKAFRYFFITGILCLSFTLYSIQPYLTLISILCGSIIYLFVLRQLKTLTSAPEEYEKVMRIKYAGGLFFSIAMIGLIIFL